MIEASLVLFAIQAGGQLGQNGYTILVVDKNLNAALSLPEIKYKDNTDEDGARDFFNENAEGILK